MTFSHFVAIFADQGGNQLVSVPPTPSVHRKREIGDFPKENAPAANRRVSRSREE